MKENNFDAIGLCETWLTTDMDSKFLIIPNYDLIRADRTERGGGVAFYVKSHLKYKVYFSNINTDSGMEHLWLTVHLKSKKVGIGVLYKPPCANVSGFEEISEILENIYMEVDYVILVGDINVNLLYEHRDAKYFNDIISSFNLTQIVNSPTRITRTTESLIDVICLSNNLEYEDVKTMDLGNMTDHMLVSCKINIQCNKEVSGFYTRCYNKFDNESFANDALAMDWNLIAFTDDLNLQVEMLNKNILDLFNKHAPLKFIKHTNKSKPYITYNLKEMIKLKNKAHKKYLKTKSLTHKNYYIDLKNYVNLAIKREKIAYMEYTYKKSKNNQKNLWQNLRSWGVHNPCTKNIAGIPDGLKDPDQINNYFVNVAGETNIDHEYLNYFNVNNSNFSNDTNSFKFKEVDVNDIYKYVATIKTNSYGIDNINLKMLNIVLPFCVHVLKAIFNKSLTTGIIPKIWKYALVLPIPKIAKPSEFKDLRPINILPILSKLLEKIVADQLKIYINTFNILPKNQSGFREGYSTCTALMKVIDDISHNIDRTELTLLVLLDQSKAFDLVNFDLLLAKLTYLNITNVELYWFKNYLQDRYQAVKLENTISNKVMTKSGVPQGSILGPILFSIFLFDLETIFTKCQIHMYADDIQIYTGSKVSNINDGINILNYELNKFSNWCCKNGLRINPNKSVAICVGNERLINQINFDDIKILINDTEIQWVQTAKNLGLYMDSLLNFNEHVTNIFKQCFMVLKSIHQFKFSLPEELKLKIVKSLIYPKIEYCCVVYYNFLTLLNKNKLQRVQNACFRFICITNYREHITPHINRHCELKIENRIKLLFCQFLYKVVNNNTPDYLVELLSRRSEIHNINVRTNNYTIPQHSTRKFEGSFSYCAPTELNEYFDLLSLSYGMYKKEVKTILLNSQL